MRQTSEQEAVRLLLFLTEEVHDLLGQELALAEERRNTIADLTRRHGEIRVQRSESAAARREVIVSLISHHGWTQSKVAELLEISVPRVNYIINGRQPQKRAR